MPLKSQAQRRFLWANDPRLARRFEDHTSKGTDLPEKKEAELNEQLVLCYLDHFERCYKAAGIIPWGRIGRVALPTAIGVTAPVGASMGSTVVPDQLDYSAYQDLRNGTEAGKIDPSVSVPLGAGLERGDLTADQLNGTAIPWKTRAKLEGSRLLSNVFGNDSNNTLFDMASKIRGAAAGGNILKAIWKTPMRIPWGRSLLAGLGMAVGDRVNHFVSGAEFHGTDDERPLESWWKPQVRNIRNIVANAGGGGAVAGYPGAVLGALNGAWKEPSEAWGAMRRTWAGAHAAEQNTADYAFNAIKDRPNLLNDPHFTDVVKQQAGGAERLQGLVNVNNLKGQLGVGAGILGVGLAGYGLHKMFGSKPDPKKPVPLTPKIARWI